MWTEPLEFGKLALFTAATEEIAAFVTELLSLPKPERKDRH